MPTTTAATTEGLIINGERSGASDGASFDVFDPSTGGVLAHVAKATKADVDRAVKAAHGALESKAWGGLTPAERSRILFRMAQAIRDRAEELAELESRDNGKPLRQARTDVQVAARYFEFFAGAADKIMGNTIPLGPGLLDFTIREPIGVSAQIVPWNYPIQIGARGVAPALAAGCAVVMKPSSEAPMTALRLGEVGLACGLPPGALNIVPGTGSEAGTALASHPEINQLTFTGSVDVGVAVAKMAAENVVPVVMELGGKSPNVVFADADLDVAAQGVSNAIFQNAGQTCSAGSRLLVERAAHDAFLERLVARAGRLRVGDGTRAETDVGPAVSAEQRESVLRYLELGKAEGAEQVYAGTLGGLDRGHWLAPTVFDRVSPAMRIAREEIFGPVLSVIRAPDAEAAFEAANAVEYGLAASVYTRDVQAVFRFVDRVDVGIAHVNQPTLGGEVHLPFGGVKASGIGPHEQGREAIDFFTKVKTVYVNHG
jgi:acyl-CoA reductase-like NAD-dependent aldehyde dehydrogenase